MSDISGLINSTGIALEQEAYRQFGAAVEGQVGGILGSIFSQPTTPLSPTDAASVVKQIQPGVMDVTSYAGALSGGKPTVGNSPIGQYAPKTKFLFKVKFEFHPEAAQVASSLGVDVFDIGRDITFVIKQIDLPKVEYEYEEVNMYNFKTKVLKSMRYRDLNFTFYDDAGNHALSFVNVYMQILSPLSRVSQSPTLKHEDHGFAFNPNYYGLDTSTRAAIPNRKDILSKMTVEQFYVDTTQMTPANISQLVKLNSFEFINPRLSSFDISDQDHEVGGVANTISAVFDFDSLHIEQGKLGMYSVSPVLNGNDILHGMQEEAAKIIRSSATPAGKSQNPFVNIIARQGQRMVQQTVGGALNKALGGVAGGALQGAIYKVTGALGDASNKTLRNVSEGVSQGIALPSSSPIKDNSSTSNNASQTSSRPDWWDKLVSK